MARGAVPWGSQMFRGSGACPACILTTLRLCGPPMAGWGTSPAQALQTSGRGAISRLGSWRGQRVWSRLGLGTEDPGLGTLSGLATTPDPPDLPSGARLPDVGPSVGLPVRFQIHARLVSSRSHLKTHTLSRLQGEFKASKKCQGLKLCCTFSPG